MILACHNLNKSFGDHLIVRDGSFHVEDREKAALVGVNGAGKSTIFKMIVGELPLDEGDVILTKGKTLGYLAQHQNLDTTNTIYEELKTAKSGGPDPRHRTGVKISFRRGTDKPFKHLQPADVRI